MGKTSRNFRSYERELDQNDKHVPFPNWLI